MKYSWDIEGIENKLNMANESSSNNKVIGLNVYSRMLADLSVPKRINPKISKEYFFKKIDNFDVKSFDNNIFKLINYMASDLENTEYSNKYNFDNKKTDSTVIKICKDFYKRNDKDSLNYFKRITNKENTIQFINTSAPFLGRSYIINASEFYILVNGKNYLEDSISLIHESKHIEMYFKGYNKGITHYEELSSILYELCMIDYLIKTDSNKKAINNIQMRTIDKYVSLIISLSNYINYIKKLKESDIFYKNIEENYDIFYNTDKLGNIYSILNEKVLEKEIGKIISFIVAIDIYLNSNMSNVNNVLSCYIFGIYKLKPGIIDNVLEYIKELYEPYNCDKTNKIKKK